MEAQVALGRGLGWGWQTWCCFLSVPEQAAEGGKVLDGEGPGPTPAEPLRLYSSCHVNVHFAGENSHSIHWILDGAVTFRRQKLQRGAKFCNTLTRFLISKIGSSLPTSPDISLPGIPHTGPSAPDKRRTLWLHPMQGRGRCMSSSPEVLGVPDAS